MNRETVYGLLRDALASASGGDFARALSTLKLVDREILNPARPPPDLPPEIVGAVNRLILLVKAEQAKGRDNAVEAKVMFVEALFERLDEMATLPRTRRDD